jgi:membrane associated rhomboid family serine protease
MINVNSKHYADVGRMFCKINTKALNQTSRLAMMRTVRALPRRMCANKNSLMKFVPKRNFNSKIDSQIESLVSRLPNGNIGFLFIGINSFFYLIYLLWPGDLLHKFLNNFTVSNYNLSRGRFHTLLLSHFTHMGFLSYLLDTVILYLFWQNLQMMFGPVYIAKLSILAIAMGSVLLMLQHSGSGMQRPYWGNDSILRALIFTVIFQNPTASFYLLPFPISIPAWVIAAVLLGLDFLSLNTASFGGISASYMMLNYIK